MKKIKGSIRAFNWKLLFIVLMCIGSIVISSVSLIMTEKQNNEINQIKSYVLVENDSKDNGTNSNYKDFEYYSVINERMDSAIQEILSVVGIFASIITILGVLITFKAPKDIEMEMDTIREILNQTIELSEDQKYKQKLSEALKQKTMYHRIKQLNLVIKEYPDRYDGYLLRGKEYSDKGEYDKAINDFNMAKLFGCSLEKYYNSMSVTLNKRFRENGSAIDNRQATEYISKAIELNPENPGYYNNRGISFAESQKFTEAIDDFDKSISIDPNNYEAYSNKANLYVSMINLDENCDRDTLSNKALECIRKAMDLNSEDTDNLKYLENLVKTKGNSSIINDDGTLFNSQESLVISISEKIGDIAFEHKEYLESITNYTNALVPLNLPELGLAEHNIQTIERICDKIFKCQVLMPNIDMGETINRKLQFLIVDLNDTAYQKYSNKDFEEAGRIFEYVTILSGYGSSGSNNLAYMIRRNEYSCDRFNLEMLLTCKTPDDSSSFIRINRAICYVEGIEFNQDFDVALKEVYHCENELTSAVKWWSDSDVVGQKEFDLVMLLLALMNKIELAEGLTMTELIHAAKNDGYYIPDDAEEIAKRILEDKS